MKRIRKIVALFMALVLLVQTMPIESFAAEEDEQSGNYTFSAVEVDKDDPSKISEEDIKLAAERGLTDMTWKENEGEKTILAILSWKNFENEFKIGIADLLKYRKLIKTGLQYKVIYKPENWTYSASLTEIKLKGEDNEKHYVFTLIKLYNTEVLTDDDDKSRGTDIANLFTKNNILLAELLGLNEEELLTQESSEVVDDSSEITEPSENSEESSQNEESSANSENSENSEESSDNSSLIPSDNEEGEENSENSQPQNDGEEAPNAEDSKPEDKQEETPALREDYPYQVFTKFTDNLTIKVTAPQGAFPVETKMSVKEIDESLVESFKDIVKLDENDYIKGIIGVDIEFTDYDDNKLQPLIPVIVEITPNSLPEKLDEIKDRAIIAHSPENGEVEVLEKKTDEEVQDYIEACEQAFAGAFKEEESSADAEEAAESESEKETEENVETPENTESVEDVDTSAEEDSDSENEENVKTEDIGISENGKLSEEAKAMVESSKMLFGRKMTPQSAKAEQADTNFAPVEETKDANTSFQFATSSFSPYAIIFVDSYISGDITCEGITYHVTVSYNTEAKIPDGAELVVTEIKDEETIGKYRSTADTNISANAEIDKFRLFDITIVYNGEEIQPSAPVNVTMTWDDPYNVLHSVGLMEVLHFASEEEIKDIIVPEIDYEINDDFYEVSSISFETDSFSVYAPVNIAESTAWVPNLQEISDIQDNVGYFLSVQRSDSAKRFYFKDTITSNSRISKTAANKREEAKLWYFEKVAGTTDRFYMYTMPDGETKQYCVMNPTSGNVSLSTTNKTEFIISLYNDGVSGTFYFKCGTNNSNYGFNMRGGDGGNGFSGNTNRYDIGSEITISKNEEEPDDPLSLNNVSFAMMVEPGDGSGIGVGNVAKNNNTRLDAKMMLVRPDPTGLNYEVHVLNGDEMPFYTFHNIELDKYYITTLVDGVIKYLKIKNANISLVDTPDADCELTVQSKGDGRIGIRTKNGYWLALQAGDANKGFFGTTAQSIYSEFRLLTKSALSDEDFVSYTATKVSVSDRVRVPNGAQVVIYTRKWNDAKKKYEFYVVNHNGTLFPAYDTGDSIQWVGSRINTVLWNLTEYYYEGTNTPNNYYELQSDYSERYVAPQIDGQILSEGTIGINLIGRKNNAYYTHILAWDDVHYDYAAWKLGAKSIESAPMAEADDFYFAILNPTVEEGELTTVETIDNDNYGITMKMIDFNNPLLKNRDSVQMSWFGYSPEDRAGLLSTELGPDGYPIGQYADGAGLSLSNLYNNMTEVNHLFIESIHSESGYFEYNSTENFATLYDENGNLVTDFTVYNQIGAITGNGERRVTRTHGQFMPYNRIYDGVYAYDKNGVLITNLTAVTQEELPETNPRKYEPLYLIGSESTVDYFYGMEMEANFMMTESGQDDWNHDLIFEFSGDDDFWLYIDGQLVLDLGGVHSAMTGDVNFHTGVVHGRTGKTSLYQIFTNNYKNTHPNWTQADLDAYLEDIFVLDENGSYIFKDYTSHNIRIFYMERGAGASNLRMRFNLTAVEPGEVNLTKNLTGTDKHDYASMRFPYQIYYRNTDEPAFHLVDGNNVPVVYKGTNNPVEYQSTYRGYSNVFMLRPGETANIKFRDEDTEYYIRECYVNTDIYDVVEGNGYELTAIDQGGGIADFETSQVEVRDRKKIIYSNHVNPDALRTVSIKKMLYDVNGNFISADDDHQGFKFRMYMGEGLPYYAFDNYHVKNENGEYCIFDYRIGTFASTGETVFSNLSELQQRAATFTSSMSGAIDKIPSGYSVEIRGLMPGTQFMVEERESDIPKGYSFDCYQRVEGSFLTDNNSHNSGTIRDNTNAEVEVHNKRGWGLTGKKVWYDETFMETHDNIYMGVFINGTLEPGTLRIMHTSAADGNERELYWYFHDLKPGTTFSDYRVKEVMLTNPVVDNDGYVTSYDSLQIVEGSNRLVIGGQLIGEPYKANAYSYGASYDVGTPEGADDHIRVDTVTNMRSGIKILKTDWNGTPLTGGKFIVRDNNGLQVGAEYYEADETTGLITIAYLKPNTNYTIEEVEAPLGYAATESTLTFSVDGTGVLTVTGDDPTNYSYTQENGDDMATITMKNRRIQFSIRKIDAVTEEPLEGVHFAVYRQRYTGSEYIKDYIPLAGYSDIVSDANGYLSPTLERLKPGTYYLSETIPLSDYMPLDSDILFTKLESGEVIILSQEHQHLMTETNNAGLLAYDMIIPNENTVDISISKEVGGNMGSGVKKFKFTLTNFQNRYGGTVVGTYDYSIVDADRNGIVVEAGTVTIADNNGAGVASFTKGGTSTSTAYFEIAHHQTFILEGIPKGSSFICTELYPGSPYTTTITMSNMSSGLSYFDGTSLTNVANVEGVGGTVSGDGGRRIAVTGAPSGGLNIHYTNILNKNIPMGVNTSRTLIKVLMAIGFIVGSHVFLSIKKKEKPQKEE